MIIKCLFKKEICFRPCSCHSPLVMFRFFPTLIFQFLKHVFFHTNIYFYSINLFNPLICINYFIIYFSPFSSYLLFYSKSCPILLYTYNFSFHFTKLHIKIFYFFTRTYLLLEPILQHQH